MSIQAIREKITSDLHGCAACTSEEVYKFIETAGLCKECYLSILKYRRSRIDSAIEFEKLKSALTGLTRRVTISELAESVAMSPTWIHYQLKTRLKSEWEVCQRIPDPKAAATMPRVVTIQEAVAQKFRVTVYQILSNNRDKNVVLARHVAMYLARDITDLSHQKIGDMFDNRNPSTVSHAYVKILKRISKDSRFSESIAALKKDILLQELQLGRQTGKAVGL